MFQAAAVVNDNKPADSWPDTGLVDINDYSTRYRPGLDLVLRDISGSIQPGEKVTDMFYSLCCISV